MHTTTRLSRLSSSLGRLRQYARIVLPGLLVISAMFGVSLIEARRGENGVKSEAVESPAVITVPAAATITVNDAGNAVANDGKCTLREAITAANTNAHQALWSANALPEWQARTTSFLLWVQGRPQST